MSGALLTLNETEVNILLSALRRPYGGWLQKKTGVRNHCMAVLMVDAGLRVGELVTLKIQQLYFAGDPVGALAVSTLKKKKTTTRTIPLTVRCHDAIAEMQVCWWRDEPQSPLHYAFYVATPLHPITTRQVERIMAINSRANLGKGIHPHVLRHTFATRLMATSPIRVVQYLLGHASIKTTQIYQHPNQRHMQTAIDTLNKAGSETSGT